MKTTKEAGELKDKKILLRVDFDVPISKKGQIVEEFRIKSQKQTIDYLLDNGAKVVMVSHISATSSFRYLVSRLEGIIGRKIKFIENIEDLKKYEFSESLTLLDNIRRYKGEEENDPKLALDMANGFDLYVNNAFAVCHRNHASVSAITTFLKSYAGFLIEEEVDALKKSIDAPSGGKVIIMGGAKASTKIPVIKNFVGKAEKILVAGVIANDILKERGGDVLDSVTDFNSKELLAGLIIHDPCLILPEDFNIFERKFLDVGPKTLENFTDIINKAKMVIWNGPLGIYEDPRFSKGTDSIARAIANSAAFKIVGGGDSAAAIDKLGILDKFNFVSTGGGAMLEFLAGNRLPGLEVLGYYD